MAKPRVCIFWFRRDLRFEDNTGLSEALALGLPVVPLFIFDIEILDQLEDRDDSRVEFIHRCLQSLDLELRKTGRSFVIEHGRPLDVWAKVLRRWDVAAVYFNHDYEPSAIRRDDEVTDLLSKYGVTVRSFKDQVVFERDEVQKDAGGPYTVFTPYSRKWKSQLEPRLLRSRPIETQGFLQGIQDKAFPALESLGFKPGPFSYPAAVIDRELIARYAQNRDIPSQRGTSRLGLHLRFGTVSGRRVVRLAQELSETWLNELIWREFFMQILFHFPHVVDGPFRPEYRGVRWRHDEEQFAAWCEGRTGYPIVDAGMRELNATGFMHNRVRMIAGSFLAKHLMIDWRWGEAYFARKLLDFELASNNGNWQWVAGTGCDAAPYFRIFNPEAQTKKFDPDLKYVKTWVPELGTKDYPQPIVDHAFARARALREYKAGLEAFRGMGRD